MTWPKLSHLIWRCLVGIFRTKHWGFPMPVLTPCSTTTTTNNIQKTVCIRRKEEAGIREKEFSKEIACLQTREINGRHFRTLDRAQEAANLFY